MFLTNIPFFCCVENKSGHEPTDLECVVKKEERRATWKRGSRALDRISRAVLPLSYCIILLVFLLPPYGEIRLAS
jgi:hypothetical protein